MAKGVKKNFKLPNPQEQVQNLLETQSKYKVGESGVPFHQIKNYKPVFAFDYLSENSTDLCINNKLLKSKDLIGFLIGLKKISQHSYAELRKTQMFRFHKIDFEDERVKLKPKQFLDILAPSGRGLKEDELPTLYQIDLQYQSEARAAGFLYKGVFYIVWYDRHHKIYPRS